MEIHFTASNVGSGKQFWCQILSLFHSSITDFVFILVAQEEI